MAQAQHALRCTSTHARPLPWIPDQLTPIFSGGSRKLTESKHQFTEKTCHGSSWVKTSRKRWVIGNQRLWFCDSVCSAYSKRSTLERMKLSPSPIFMLRWAWRLQSALKLCCARRSTNTVRDNPPSENNLKSNQEHKTERGETKTQRWKDLAAVRRVSGRAGDRALPPGFQVSALTSISCLSSEPGSLYVTNLLLITLYVLLLPERLCKITLLSWRYERKIKRQK